MKTKSRKDTPRRVTEQAAGVRMSEEERGKTPHETQLEIHERKQAYVRPRFTSH